MSDLYGGTLRIDDRFTITLNRFKNSMNGAGSSLKKFTNESSRSSIIFKDKCDYIVKNNSWLDFEEALEKILNICKIY